MRIDKEIISKLYREYFFISGILDVDDKYFKKRIDEGVQNSNLNYKTNVMGQQTSWKFFNSDKNFGILLCQMIDYLEGLNCKLDPFCLTDSWGLIERFGEFTNKHNHGPCVISGILYLNDHYQKLHFPQINQEITPKKGRFVLFSSFLDHYTKRNIQNTAKYAISFNFFHSEPQK
jgi:hypothetical protein